MERAVEPFYLGYVLWLCDEPSLEEEKAARSQIYVATSVYRIIIQRQEQFQLSSLSRIIYCDS